ncbi:MAG: hypothetical protein UU95_C0014G0004 [Parcubacteria group bacterium GW2011_GWC2_42_12]|nr:MAG: hypothetical protein UU95_C0014G0004 [Parcubacteria group bacterium GW2011_GWC2_42_12]
MLKHHLIFEGAELAGKSWLMSQIYNYLEPKYNQSGYLLDGCHWFNCDVGVYGTKHGRPIIEFYLKIFNELKNSNLLIEKFHLSDIVYNRLHRQQEIDYKKIEQQLRKLGFKIILITLPPNEKIIQARIADRLKLYPNYKKIMHQPSWYIKQQEEYLKEIKKTTLPYLIIKTKKLPDDNLTKEILIWLNEIK